MSKTQTTKPDWRFYREGVLTPFSEKDFRDVVRQMTDHWQLSSGELGTASFIIEQLWSEIGRLRAAHVLRHLPSCSGQKREAMPKSDHSGLVAELRDCVSSIDRGDTGSSERARILMREAGAVIENRTTLAKIKKIVRETQIPVEASDGPHGFHLRRGAKYLREAILQELERDN